MKFRFPRIPRLPGLTVWLAAQVLRLWRLTLRVRIEDPMGVLDNLPPTAVVVCWHNRMLLLPTLVPRKVKGRITVLASRSRDGGYIADLLRHFDIDARRGSSSKGGAAALNEMRADLERGRYVLITPDGPRGPRYQLRGGAVWLADRGGAPILPVSVNAARRWELKSWDRTQMPWPFSTVRMVLGAPITPSGADPEARQQQVHRALMAITED